MNNKKMNVPILMILSAFVCAVLIGRVMLVSVFKTANGKNLLDYTEIANERSSITQARRGTIFDSKGLPIAMDTTSYSLYAVLNTQYGTDAVKDLDYTANVLSQYINLSRDKILDILRTPDANQVEFGLAGNNISNETKELIEKAQLPGIYLTSQTTRHYINDVYASHLIGYASPLVEENNTNNHAQILKGELGVELAYNNLLSGQENYQTQWNNTNNLNYLSGNDIYLTLDSRLQNQLEDLLTISQQIYQPKEQGAYLVELKTGKLLAASQRPTFNLNTRDGIEEEWRDYLVEEAFEPGSTIKILTMAVAYDNKLFTPTETYTSGTIEVFDTKISDHNLVGWGNITFEEGLARSSNTAMVTLMKRFGDENWISALARFGFGKVTNSGLPNELEGNFNFDNPVSRYMASFGQAFSATPIQLLESFTAIANHGTMVKVQYIEGIGVERNQYQVKTMGTPISQQAADYVLGLMVETVEADYGTAGPFKSDKVSVAAKTGTAQIANETGTGYLTGENNYLHSVVAFFPAEDPQYMMYLFMKQPAQMNGLLGSQILAKTFHPFLDAIMINQ